MQKSRKTESHRRSGRRVNCLPLEYRVRLTLFRAYVTQERYVQQTVLRKPDITELLCIRRCNADLK